MKAIWGVSFSGKTYLARELLSFGEFRWFLVSILVTRPQPDELVGCKTSAPPLQLYPDW